MEAILNEVRSLVTNHVAAGCHDAADLIATATRYVSEEHGREDLGGQVERITHDLLLDHYRAQARWGWYRPGEWTGPTAEEPVATGYVVFEVLRNGAVRAAGEVVLAPGVAPREVGRLVAEALAGPSSPGVATPGL
jgi:hypothetical protein